MKSTLLPEKYTQKKIKEVSKYLQGWLKDSWIPAKDGKIPKYNKTWIINPKEEQALKIVIDLLNDCI